MNQKSDDYLEVLEQPKSVFISKHMTKMFGLNDDFFMPLRLDSSGKNMHIHSGNVKFQHKTDCLDGEGFIEIVFAFPMNNNYQVIVSNQRYSNQLQTNKDFFMSIDEDLDHGFKNCLHVDFWCKDFKNSQVVKNKFTKHENKKTIRCNNHLYKYETITLFFRKELQAYFGNVFSTDVSP